MNALGPFPFYMFLMGVNCEDGVGLQLTMKERKGSSTSDIAVIDKMDFDCEYFSFWDNIHLTIPKVQQKLIKDKFRLYSNLFDRLMFYAV